MIIKTEKTYHIHVAKRFFISQYFFFFIGVFERFYTVRTYAHCSWDHWYSCRGTRTGEWCDGSTYDDAVVCVCVYACVYMCVCACVCMCSCFHVLVFFFRISHFIHSNLSTLFFTTYHTLTQSWRDIYQCEHWVAETA